MYANTIPLSNQSLFGGSIKTVVTKATSAARDYAAMAKGFVQTVLYHPKSFWGKETHKRKYEGSPQPFHGKTCQSTSSGWRNRSSSKEKRLNHDRAPRTDLKSSEGPKPSIGQNFSTGIHSVTGQNSLWQVA